MTTEKPTVIFREAQRFSLWIRLPFVFLMVFVVIIEYFAFKSMLAESNPPGSWNIALPIVIGICLPSAICILLWTATLVTEVRPDGLYIRFFPFHLRYKKIAIEDLHECYARTYRPIREYGGFGIRYSLGFKSKAYNTTGNRGVQLIFKNGRKLLIGSQKADELADAIGSLRKPGYQETRT